MPRITTTGVFNTIFAQLGNFTFTLPSAPGTLAMTSDIAVETTRAMTAEAANATAITTEATTRASAITTEATTRAAAITAETTRAIAAEALAYNNIGRNLLHNPEFLVAQRGFGPFTTTGYTSDRWSMGRGTGGGTGSVSVASLSDADRTAIGDEAAQRALVYTVTGGSGAGDFDEINQRMEGVKRTSGKTVTVSFWAKATSGAPTIGLNWQQSFGTGGSPSTVVVGTAQTVTLSTTWTRYSKTFAITSVSGKTFGTTPQTDFLEFNFWLSSGASFNTEAGGIGVQTGIFSFWAMQLEIAPSASSFEKLDYALQTIECLRFFQVIQIIFNGNVPAGTSVAVSNSLLTAMRVTPTLVLINVTNTNLSGVSGGSTISSVYITATAVATTGFSINTTITASSDL